ncbi:MAG TPA: TonB-dependent receptor [Candidatus Polarisedimenticolaceae bacterium]|nr:TonB-dependent receptor [Candidatus Polarisedimenticolaceae bacterium]
MRRLARFLHTVLALTFAAAAAAQEGAGAGVGRIEGRLTLPEGDPISGVVVVVSGVGVTAVTGADGQFVLVPVPPGTYAVTFSLGDQVHVEEGVVVTAGQATRLDRSLDWRLSIAEAITVYGASRRQERLVEAPAAVTVVTEREIEQVAATGQLPNVLASTPGVDFTQSGVFDFNFSSRGFNSSLNRRVLTLIDGRDPAIGFLGAQEWSALSFPLDELDTVELVRGPGSALYGANAFNGVLSMYSKEPKSHLGGKLRLTGGELSTLRADLRYAGKLGQDWYYRATAGGMDSGDYAVSRVCPAASLAPCLVAAPPFDQSFEYPGIPGERVPLAREDDDQVRYGSLRVDKYFARGQALTVEGGTADVEGPVFLTGIGRVQVLDASRPWGRANFNADHWNALFWYTGRDTNDPQISLRSGAELWENSSTMALELQGHVELLAEDRLRLVGGVSRRHQDIDTADPSGRQTLMDQAHENDMDAVFGQADYQLTSAVKLVLAARYDTSDLHDSQFSPKAAVVWQVRPQHGLRLTYNEAFQAPNYSELFLRADVAAPVNLSGIQAALDASGLNPGGVSLGFGTPAAPVPTRVMALGNESLEVEEIEGFELGYTGAFRHRWFVTADVYDNTVKNFVTDLLPLVNPAFGPYAPPSALSPQAQAFVLGALDASLPPQARAILSNFSGGQPVFAAASYTNAGEVDTRGVELGVSVNPFGGWLFEGNYSWFDFDVKSQQLGDQLVPNAPENKFNLGIGWRNDTVDVGVNLRWVDSFAWATGVFVGEVPSYSVVDLHASWALRRNVTLGMTGTNVLDDEHYEIFGGDVLQRRLLGYVTWSF